MTAVRLLHSRLCSRVLCRLLVGALLTGGVLAGCSRAPIERVEWPVMGTIAAVQYNDNRDVPLWDVAPNCTKWAFAEVERLLNAHDPKSEISRLAALPEKDVLERCDAQMRPCYEMAFRLMRESGGAFNPRWQGPKRLDLGAIAKGFAVDFAAETFSDLKRKSGWRMLIDLGGNLKAVKGDWTVGIKDGESFVLHEGCACATSAEYYRGKHIYDGRTGQAVSNGVASVTVVVNGSAMEADGLSTTLFVLGPEEGKRFLDEKWKTVGVQAVWFLADGRCISHLSHADSIPR